MTISVQPLARSLTSSALVSEGPDHLGPGPGQDPDQLSPGPWPGPDPAHLGPHADQEPEHRDRKS